MFAAAFRNRLYTSLLLTIILVAGAGLIAWPLLGPSDAHTPAALSFVPWLVVPLGFGLLLNELIAHHLSIKALAIAGIVVALAAALRPLGAGVAGIEPLWVVLILAARAFGSATGFVIAVSAIVVSSLVTGGIGPWLP